MHMLALHAPHLRLPLWLLLPLAAVFGALGRRIAGGVLNQWFRPPGQRVFGDLPARAIYGAALGAAAFGAGAPAWWVAVIAAAIVAGCAVPVWAIDLGPGHPGTSPLWLRIIGSTAHGLLSIAPATVLAAMAGAHWLWLLGGSLSIAPLYWLGSILARPFFPNGLRAGSEDGEALWGAVLAVTFILTVHGA